MNQLLGTLLIIAGIALARWSRHLRHPQSATDEPANPDDSESWMFAAGLGLILVGVAALNVEPVGVLLALVLPGVLLCTALAAIGLVLDRPGKHQGHR